MFTYMEYAQGTVEWDSRFYYSQINVDKDDFILTIEVIVDNFILKKHIINQNNYRDSLFTVEELWKKR